MAAFDEELDMLDECLNELADTTLTLTRQRPAGSLNTQTRKRAAPADPARVTINAVTEDDQATGGRDRRTRTRSWMIHAADVTWYPGPTTEIRDHADETDWKLLRCLPARAGRDYQLIGEASD